MIKQAARENMGGTIHWPIATIPPDKKLIKCKTPARLKITLIR